MTAATAPRMRSRTGCIGLSGKEYRRIERQPAEAQRVVLPVRAQELQFGRDQQRSTVASTDAGSDILRTAGSAWISLSCRSTWTSAVSRSGTKLWPVPVSALTPRFVTQRVASVVNRSSMQHSEPPPVIAEVPVAVALASLASRSIAVSEWQHGSPTAPQCTLPPEAVQRFIRAPPNAPGSRNETRARMGMRRVCTFESLVGFY